MAFTPFDTETEAKAQISRFFSSVTRRGSRGPGGAGNPYATWKEIKTLLCMSLILDEDAVFSHARWTGATIQGLCDECSSLCSTMITAASALTRVPLSLEDLTELEQAWKELTGAIVAVRATAPPAGLQQLTSLQNARTQITDFARRLAPAVDPSLSGVQADTPREARRTLRAALARLLEASVELEDVLDRMPHIPESLRSLPPGVASGILREIRSLVERTTDDMGDKRPAQRTGNARTDIARLSAALTVLDAVSTLPTPVLVRASGTAAAVGVGSGSAITGTLSAPWALADGARDNLELVVDGLPPVTVDLPAEPNLLALELPFCAAIGVAEYNVPAAPDNEILMGIGGVLSVPVALTPGLRTAVQIKAELDALPPPAGMQINVVPHGPVETLQFVYLTGVLGALDLGSYVELTGDAPLMHNLGFPGSDEDDPTQLTVRQFWRAASQPVISAAIRRNFQGLNVENANSAGLGDDRGWTSATLPNVVRYWRFWGSGQLYSESGRLTLTGDDISRIRSGDRAALSPTQAYTVLSVESDGVLLDMSSGAAITDGAYTPVIVSPQLSGVLVGSTLRIHHRGLWMDYRISARAYDAATNGVLEISCSKPLEPYPLGVVRLSFEARMDRLVLASANAGPTGSLLVGAPANPAAPSLGLAVGAPATAGVYEIEDANASFVAARVRAGDLVVLTGVGTRTVERVVSATRLRLTSEIPGTFSNTYSVRNYKYDAYDAYVSSAEFTAWTPLDADELLRLAGECVLNVRVGDAVANLTSFLTSLRTRAQNLSTRSASFRVSVGELSSYMVDCRRALEEAGADRGVWMLVHGQLGELLHATSEDVSSARTLMRDIRTASRELLRTSVFRQDIVGEAGVMGVRPSTPGNEPPLEGRIPGPPRGVRG